MGKTTVKVLRLAFLVTLFSFISFHGIGQTFEEIKEKAEEMRSNRNWKGAIVEYSNAIEIFPDNPYAFYNLAICKLETGDLDGAIDDFSTSLTLGFSNPEQLLTNRGIAYLKNGQINLALKDYDEAIQINSKFANAYSNRGYLFSSIKKYEEALKDLNKAISYNPKSKMAYLNRGAVKRKLNDYKGAMKDYTKAIKLFPDFSSLYFNRAGLKEALGDLVGAKADLIKAISLESENETFYFNLGNVLSGQKKYEEAIQAYSMAIKIDPYYFDAFINRGTVRAIGASPDFLGSILDFSRAIELDPTSATAHNNRGFTRSNLGEFEKSINDFNRAIEADPNFALAYKNRAKSRIQLNQLENVCEDLKKAVELGADGSKELLEKHCPTKE